MRITGFEAIEYAEKAGLTLNKHPDNTDGPRQGLSVAEAEAIATDAPELVWLDVDEAAYYETPGSIEPQR